MLKKYKYEENVDINKRHIKQIQKVLEILKEKFNNDGFQKSVNFSPDYIIQIEELIKDTDYGEDDGKKEIMTALRNSLVEGYEYY